MVHLGKNGADHGPFLLIFGPKTWHFQYRSYLYLKRHFLDKINQWGPSFRESYTRLGLLKPFMAENASVYFLTATATPEDMKV